LSEPELPLLDADRAQALSSLLGIGCRSGDTIVGLSAVRRAGKLSFVFASGGLAVRTLRELAGMASRGARVYRVADFDALTHSFGRADAQVVGVVRGDLAKGLAKRLKGEKQ
jgi:hypothetical protein